MRFASQQVETENANNANGQGLIDIKNFVPFPKNPTIAKFFIQLGRVDELGSGVINVNRYIQEYAPDGKPDFIEGATFKMRVPLPEFEVEKTDDGVNDGVNDGAIDGATKGVKEKLSALLKAIAANEGKRAPDYIKVVDVAERTMERYLQQLKKAALVEFKGDAPQTGGYYLTKKMKAKLKR